MAITLDNVSVSANVSNTTVSWSHFCTVGANLLVVAIQVVDSTLGDRTVSSVTYAGAALTNSGYTKDDGSAFRTEIWYKVNPSIGPFLIVVTMGGKCTDLIANAISLKGVDTTNPIDSGNTGGATSANPSVTVTTQTSDTWLVDSIVNDLASTDGCSADYTSIHLTDIGADIAGGQYRDTTGVAGNYAISWVMPEDNWVMSAVAIRAAAVGTNIKINIGDAWKDVDSMKINIGDVWKDVISVQQNIGDVWKTVF